jgi:hypothetical protein
MVGIAQCPGNEEQMCSHGALTAANVTCRRELELVVRCCVAYSGVQEACSETYNALCDWPKSDQGRCSGGIARMKAFIQSTR